MKAVVGIDTSNYTTSVAAVDAQGNVIASIRKLLPVKTGERGLRQSDAVFAHVRQLPGLIESLSHCLGGYEIAAICCSSRPRDNEDSYMPVFQVGEANARALAAMLGVPCFYTTHQRGHMQAALIDAGLEDRRFLMIHLSGGTTELLHADHDALQLLGGTKDLHAGQFVDRVGVALGLDFPAGPALEKLARKAEKAEACLPVSMEDKDLFCHFSGAETRAQQYIRSGMAPEQVAIEVYDLLARTIARLASAGAAVTGTEKVLIAGGVASSALFREMLSARNRKAGRLDIYWGKPEYSGDNACGVARIGRNMLLGKE
ncbi:MAG: O-sialoglycoprotein endopeptidase [Clostridia bacterium]|nr:O-sialoglycoprotein endopeptidase [Clostridia bacterium]